jgi:protein-S-isoprenylcysteine O-methyltransferase Ste14
MEILLRYIVPGLWAVFYAIWGLAALGAKEPQRSESPFSRLAILLVTILGFALALTAWFRIGPLAWRFTPHTLTWALAGVLIEALGIGYALLARAYLGRNWSGTVAIKKDHQLISSGPYALSRNPIYTGILLGLLGTAIAYGELRGLFGLALVLLAFLAKMSIEEKFLSQQFGAEYTQYRRHVKALIPFIL